VKIGSGVSVVIMGQNMRLDAMPVATWANEWVCGSWQAEIACSNPTGGVDISLVNVLCCLTEVSVMRRSLVKGGRTDCVCVCVCH
jgi:hypothetical protein